MKYNTATLSNGLRVIHMPSSSPVVYCGYCLRAGSRDERPGEEGLAHFCEHATFKGTERRRSWNVLNCLESVGGDLNAFTTKEDTTYHAAVLKQDISRAIDILTDIVFHSTYPQGEIDKEVEVICDEIESYNDTPSELIYDEFENLVFDGHPLGHAILGTTTNVRGFDTNKAHEFTNRFYKPCNSVFFVYGDLSFKRIINKLCAVHQAKMVETAGPKARADDASPEKDKGQHTGRGGIQDLGNDAHDGDKHVWLDKLAGQKTIVRKGTHQAHVMVGSRAYDIYDRRRMALYLLNNMIGGPGMNTRLNLILREHHGLVYTVESSMVSYGDTGVWCTYFGCDPHDVDRCLRLVRRELDSFMQNPISPTRLNAAKKQLKGQIGVACDNRESFALDFGKSFLHYGWEKDINQLYKNIDELTADNLHEVANDIFNESRLTTLIYK